MTSPVRLRLAGALLVAATSALGQGLVPAGTLNDAEDRPDPLIVSQADASITAYATTIQKSFFPNSRVLADADAKEPELAAADFLVYGTPQHAWLARHAAELPFHFGDGALEIDGRRFEGQHLRLICALRNPGDASRRVVVYAAAKAEDVVGINGIFHGPTEW